MVCCIIFVPPVHSAAGLMGDGACCLCCSAVLHSSFYNFLLLMLLSHGVPHFLFLNCFLISVAVMLQILGPVWWLVYTYLIASFAMPFWLAWYRLQNVLPGGAGPP